MIASTLTRTLQFWSKVFWLSPSISESFGKNFTSRTIHTGTKFNDKNKNVKNKI